MMKWVSCGVVFIILAGLLTSIACANEVVSYCQKNDLSPQLTKLFKSLGSGGMDQNEKSLIDEVILLPSAFQTNDRILSLLREITQDKKVTDEELSKFRDPDGDGLKNSEELKSQTNLLNPDSDNDELKDGEEVFTFKTNPLKSDSDGDGLKDGEEVLTYKTNPANTDSDNDGFSDGDEVLILKMNPLNPRFDYNPDTLVTEYSQIKPIIEKICRDFDITSTLAKTSIKVVSNAEFVARWKQVGGEGDPVWGQAIWSLSKDLTRCDVFIPQDKFYVQIGALFTALGDINHAFLYPDHYRSASDTMKRATRFAFEAAILRCLEESGYEIWQVGATDRNKREFFAIVSYYRALPTERIKFVTRTNWLPATEDESLALSTELKANKKLSSKSALKLYEHLLKQDNAYPDKLMDKVLKRTTLDSYLNEVFGIIESRFVFLKPQEERDVSIVRAWFFYLP